MLDKLKKVLLILFVLHLAVGAVIILLMVLAGPMVIGAGQFDQLTLYIETFDFKWWLVAAGVAVWLWPVALAGLYLWIRRLRRELELLQAIFYRALDHSIPIEVEINDRIRVHLDEPIEAPIEVDTELDFDELVNVETEIPFKGEIPIDTVVETSVLGIGTVKIPMRARIPLDVTLPVNSRVRVRARGVPIHLAETARAVMPPFEIPLSTRVETTINLLSNVRHAEEAIKARLG